MSENVLILGENQYYSLDSYKTKLNNNVLVVGTSGAGKTRSIVIPNMLQASGSYIISDPKGNLYKKYKTYLEKQGYVVRKLDFTDPENSSRYNFFKYINNTQDIVKVAHMLMYQYGNASKSDPFWDEAGQLLVQAIIAYLREEWGENEQTLSYFFKLLDMCNVDEDSSDVDTALDLIMEELHKKDSNSYSYKTYRKFRIAASKTLKSIMISVNARLGLYDTPELNKLMAYDDIDIASIGKRKTALFVVVSDTDRSLDGLVNIFFTQAMNELCRYADRECEDSRLPVDVRFILDDFATNCKINDFPRMISSIRSRGISTMLMIQAESQLEKSYGADAKTIISNCDSYVYLGGNDVETAKVVAQRCDLPVKKILNMPIGTNWIFRRGQEPINSKNFDLDSYLAKKNSREMEDR